MSGSWAVLLEAVAPMNPDVTYPRLVEGARHGPRRMLTVPGGEFLEAIADSTTVTKHHSNGAAATSTCINSISTKPIVASHRLHHARTPAETPLSEPPAESSGGPHGTGTFGVISGNDEPRIAKKVTKRIEAL